MTSQNDVGSMWDAILVKDNKIEPYFKRCWMNPDSYEFWLNNGGNRDEIPDTPPPKDYGNIYWG